MRLIRYLIVGVLSVPVYAVESGSEGASIESEESAVIENPLEDTALRISEEGPSETDPEEAKKRERKKKKAEYDAEYYKERKTEISEKQKKYRNNNKDKIAAYKEKNKDKITAYQKAYHKERNQRKKAERLAARRAEEQGAVQEVQGAGGPEELAALEVVRKQVHREEDPSDGVGGIEQEGNVIPGVISREVVPLATEERKDQGWDRLAEFAAEEKAKEARRGLLWWMEEEKLADGPPQSHARVEVRNRWGFSPIYEPEQREREEDGQVLFEEDVEK